MLWFAAASLLAVLALGFAATAILRRQARGEAIRDAKEITRLAGEGIAEPALSRQLLAGDRSAQARFGRVIRARVLKDPVVRVKLWTLDGRVVYSDEQPLVGRRFSLEPGGPSAAAQPTGARRTSATSAAPRTASSGGFGKLLEVYLPITAPTGGRLLFEDYIRFGAITPASSASSSRFAPALGVALLLLWLVQLPLAWSLARRLRQRQREREALLQRAIDSSALERRRIAQHLHDGVVQDLAGSLVFRSAAAGHARRGPGLDPRRAAAGAEGAAHRDLPARASSAPGWRRPSLDLLAPLSARGASRCESDIAADLALAPETEELIFRSAQEALRNVAKHADPAHVEVGVSRSNGSVVLAVRDDGRGFDPAAAGGDAGPSLGLRLLEDLVEERRGRLEVQLRRRARNGGHGGAGGA